MDALYIEHITTDGERWDQIAYRYYGDPFGYARIIMANPHIAVTPVLDAGQRLAIPVIDTEQTSQELPPWLQ
ncbi:TPA: tail protein X [Salmonella enterica subsp. enterica serovar Napoli]|nr:tail protein X [Salmonella enterica subsp. enterica serovar Napoli]